MPSVEFEKSAISASGQFKVSDTSVREAYLDKPERLIALSESLHKAKSGRLRNVFAVAVGPVATVGLGIWAALNSTGDIMGLFYAAAGLLAAQQGYKFCKRTQEMSKIGRTIRQDVSNVRPAAPMTKPAAQ